MDRKIAVVGGGAAGMMAAIQAAWLGAQVTIYEGNDRVGKKILSTGNGKCNFSNERMGEDYYYGSGKALVDRVYKYFGVRETKKFFEGLGMRVKDRDGYLYPASGQASTVLDMLRYELERLRVRVHTEQKVTEIVRQRGKLIVVTTGHKREMYDAVILACGGRAAPKTGSDGTGFLLARKLGHRIVPTVPALTALRCRGDFFKRIAGVRCDARLTLQIDGEAVRSERGELQWTDYGISGIPVFQLSRLAAYALQDGRNVTVEISLLPDDMEKREDEESPVDKESLVDKENPKGGRRDRLECEENLAYKEKYAHEYRALEVFWEQRWIDQSSQTMERFVTGIVNKKIGMLFLKLSGIKETEQAGQVSQSRRERLEELFRSFMVTVEGTNSFEQAQVCAGGIDCLEVTEELESRLVPGLFFVGEILDIDGICGGYNLQWAWSSGCMAGRAAAKR
ncbi:MAG: aminoacetone oxidase family FAD-binding enzyme [Eubacterium sp.]|nr:aminoacetone oxidase family FAD-binding enzyme [Eubacterium sp.]